MARSTASTSYGTLKEFHVESDSIKAYLERAELYSTANTIAREKQVPILLSAIGPSTYSLLSDLLAPEAPKSKSLAELSEVLLKHFEPKRAIIAERFHFHKRQQAPGETITDDAALRKLATHCKFGNYLEEALRDRLVCGLHNEAIQLRLLAEADLTYAKAMEMAQGLEAAEKSSRSFKKMQPFIKKTNRVNHSYSLPNPATDVANLTMQLLSAVSKMQTATLVERRVT